MDMWNDDGFDKLFVGWFATDPVKYLLVQPFVGRVHMSKTQSAELAQTSSDDGKKLTAMTVYYKNKMISGIAFKYNPPTAPPKNDEH